jgi:hypothetical protein
MSTIPVAGVLAGLDQAEQGPVAQGTEIPVADDAARDSIDPAFLVVGQKITVVTPTSDPAYSVYQWNGASWTLVTSGAVKSVTALASNPAAVDNADPANPVVSVTLGASADTAAAGDDPRFSDSRFPLSHADTHAGDGYDAIANATPGVMGVAGLMSSADKEKIDSWEKQFTVTPSATPTIDVANGSYQVVALNVDNVPVFTAGTAGGQELQVAFVQNSGTKSIGAINCVAKAQLVNNDNFFVPDGFTQLAGPGLTFEYRVTDPFTPTSGWRVIDIRTDVTAAQVAARTATALAGVMPFHLLLSVVSTVGATISLAAINGTPIGDATITEAVADAGFTVSGFSGGVFGGHCKVTLPSNVLVSSPLYINDAPGAQTLCRFIWDATVSKWRSCARSGQVVPPCQIRLAGAVNNSDVWQGTGFSIDGTNVADGDVVLITANNFRPKEAGPYIVNGSGVWTRPPGFEWGGSLTGQMFYVYEGGTLYPRGTLLKCQSMPTDYLDTSTLEFTLLVIGGQTLGTNDILYGNGLNSGFRAVGTPLIRCGGIDVAEWRYDGVPGGVDFQITGTGGTVIGLGSRTSPFFYYAISATRHCSRQNVVTPSATPLFNICLGKLATILMAANITSWTVTDGSADNGTYGGGFGGTEPAAEELEIQFFQTAGSLTISAPPANVILAGAFALSGVSGEMQSLRLRWNSTQAKWYETGGRAAAITY